tara:strand:+ start:284 stop:544 length:261 start_codon:yes stop_codon:yes gene_type:complete
MSCPYRTKAQFVNWLVKYKNWNRRDANGLTVHEMRKMYYSEPPIPKRVSNLPVKYSANVMDFEEACSWYQKQLYLESQGDINENIN